VELRDDRHVGAGIVRRDGRTHARAAAADHEYVVLADHR
jgi:hypothetical protein